MEKTNNYKAYMGIDSGSTMCKVALFDGEKLLGLHTTKTGWNPLLSAKKGREFLLEKEGLLPEEVLVCATGYGRDAVSFAHSRVTEITCHAAGALFLDPGVQGVIDIGGQDSKVIELQKGRVSNFMMNDKCAAGTGRFLSMACDALDIPMTEIDNFANLEESISINSMCTVFAESEIIGLLAGQQPREKILGGVLHSIARKVQQLMGKFSFEDGLPLLLTGGLSESESVALALSQTLGREIHRHPHSPFAGAIGACLQAEKAANS